MPDTLSPPPPVDVRRLARRAGDEEGMGRWDAAASLYAATFRGSVMGGDIEAAADALRGQARVRRQQHRLEEAEELADLSLELAERAGFRQAAARALNVLGIIRYGMQDYAAARDLYARARDLALDLGDDDLAGLACQNAGIIANVQGDLREARTLYLESIGSFVRSGSSVNSMIAYNNLGVASVYLSEWMEAEVYFSRGIEIGERLSHSPVLARLYSNRAHPLIEIGEWPRAHATLQRAEEAAHVVGDRTAMAEVEKFRGMLARVEGRFADADRHLSEALRVGEGQSSAFDRAEVMRELGRLREAQDRMPEALDAYRRAEEGFRSVGARHHERLVGERLMALAD